LWELRLQCLTEIELAEPQLAREQNHEPLAPRHLPTGNGFRLVGVRGQRLVLGLLLRPDTIDLWELDWYHAATFQIRKMLGLA
jgi:hypothetical protein